jgi:hypothetical protein
MVILKDFDFLVEDLFFGEIDYMFAMVKYWNFHNSSCFLNIL